MDRNECGKKILNSLAESCSQIRKAFSNWADEVRAALDRVFNNPELYQYNSVSRYPYNSVSRYPYNSVSRYHYIPRAPRNLPYMRRAF